MPGIGEQRHGMRRETVDHFGGDEREVDERGQAEGCAEIAAHMSVAMTMCMTMRVRVAVIMVVILPMRVARGMRLIVSGMIVRHRAYMEWKGTVIQLQLAPNIRGAR